MRRGFLSLRLLTSTALFLLQFQGAVEGNCRNVEASYSRDEAGGTVDHVEQLGDDIDKIDKITKVIMRAGDFCPFLCFRVIRHMEVEYRMTDGSKRTRRFGENSDIKEVEMLDIPEGEALTKVEIRTGDYLDWVKLCRSDGLCKHAGGNGGTQTKVFQKNRSAIKAFFYKSGLAVDRLGVHYETDKIIRLESDNPSFTASQDVDLDQVFSPENLLINDNSGGSSTQVKSLSTSTQVSSSETTSVSSTVGGSASLSLQTSAGINVQIVTAEVQATLSVGASWSTTNSESLTYTTTTTRELEVTLEAAPGAIEKAETFYYQADYAYTWTAPLKCYYSFDPKTAVTDGQISGTTTGFAGIPNIRTKFTTLLEPASPTDTPTKSPTLRATPMPVAPPPPPSPAACLSPQSFVNVENKGDTSVANVEVGDRVQSCDGTWTRVYSIYHKNDTEEAKFLSISTEDDPTNKLEISEDHMLFVNGRAMAGKDVQLGDSVDNAGKVVSIEVVRRKGVYAPVTTSGNFIASGMCVSSYVALWKSIDTETQNALFHRGMSAFRLLCGQSGCYGEQYHEETGYAIKYMWLLSLIEWSAAQGKVMEHIVVNAGYAMASLAYCLEMFLQNPYLWTTVASVSFSVVAWVSKTTGKEVKYE